MDKKIAFILGAIKWPLALLAVLYLPATVDVLLAKIWQLFNPLSQTGLALIVGFVSYAAIWFLLIRHSRISWLSTLEHEITHGLFALITFNRVTGLRATLRDGGHMTYQGTPNWLIQTSPYFFPTISFALLAPISVLPSILSFLFLNAVGASLAYHALSTWRETHPEQTDFRDAGFLFVICFLPAANFFSYALFLESILTNNFSLLSTIYLIHVSKWSPDIFNFL
jgi:hypothetical protein